MDINLEHIPYGVVIFKKTTLVLEDANEKFCKLFLIEKQKGLSILENSKLSFLKNIIGKINSEEYSVRHFNINEDCTVDMTFKVEKDYILVFFQEIDAEVKMQEEDTLSKMNKLKEERQQFIAMSTELKAKCDIIEILRNREKGHLMHLKDVINNISEGLIVLDSFGKYSFSNKAILSILDTNTAELINYPNIFNKYNLQEFDCNSDYENPSERFNHKRYIQSMIMLLVHKETGEKKYIEFNNNPINNEKGEFMYSIVTMKDVTSIKLHEILVQQQSVFIQDVINTMDIPISVITYPQLEATLVNDKLRSVVNQKVEKMIKRNSNGSYSIKQLLETDKYKDISKSILNCGQYGVECNYSPFELETMEGKRYYKIKFKPLMDREKKTTLILMNAMDITEEITRSLELEKLTNLKDEFFTVISHELRTPLTVIHSSLQLAYSVYGNEITPNIDKNLVRISQNCSRLLKLINNVLDISKAEAGFVSLNNVNFDIVETTEYIVNSINTYARMKDIELVFRSNCSKLLVGMDKDKYEKVVLNLLSNAMKFTSMGKKIEVTIKEESEKVRISVKDEGIGIPEDKIDSIFDRFAQVNSSLSRRAEGTGLGLSLVKKFVDIMGGTIKVKSVIDCGTEFIVTFDKKLTELPRRESFSLMDSNMKEKINLEFSDVD